MYASIEMGVAYKNLCFNVGQLQVSNSIYALLKVPFILFEVVKKRKKN